MVNEQVSCEDLCGTTLQQSEQRIATRSSFCTRQHDSHVVTHDKNTMSMHLPITRQPFQRTEVGSRFAQMHRISMLERGSQKRMPQLRIKDIARDVRELRIRLQTSRSATQRLHGTAASQNVEAKGTRTMMYAARILEAPPLVISGARCYGGVR